MSSIRYLTIQEIIAIHVAVIQKYSLGEHIGIKSQSLLESAAYLPQSSAFGEEAYLSIYAKAAALFESLGQNPPFQNANKRTAFTALVIFLNINELKFTMETKLAEDFTVDMVNHKYSLHQLVDIVENHTTR